MIQKIKFYLLFIIVISGVLYLISKEDDLQRENCIKTGGIYFYDYAKDAGHCSKLF